MSISAAEAPDRHGDARRERCPQPCLQALDLAQDFGDAVQRDLGGEGEGQGEAVGASRLPDPADLGMRPLPPLVLQPCHVGEVVAADEHVARVDRLPRGGRMVALVVGWLLMPS